MTSDGSVAVQVLIARALALRRPAVPAIAGVAMGAPPELDLCSHVPFQERPRG